MRFDLTDLRLFLNVVEAESITHGAKRSAMALPSASARIRGMEDMSGVPLLDRGSRGVRPTAAGEALAHHARAVMNQLEQMRGDLRLYAEGLRGHIRILSNTAALSYHLPDVLRRFLTDHPTIDIDLEEKTSLEIVAGVASGLADFGIAADTTDTGALEVRPFGLDRLVLIVPRTHPFVGRQSVSLRDALDEPFIGLPHGSALQAYLASHTAREGRPFKFRIRLGDFAAICAMVAEGIGLAIVPEAVALKNQRNSAIEIIRLADNWAPRRLIICARRFSTLPIHARQLIEVLTTDNEALASGA